MLEPSRIITEEGLDALEDDSLRWDEFYKKMYNDLQRYTYSYLQCIDEEIIYLRQKIYYAQKFGEGVDTIDIHNALAGMLQARAMNSSVFLKIRSERQKLKATDRPHESD